MPLLSKALTGGSKGINTDYAQELGHSLGFSRIQDVFYANGTHDGVYENVYASVRPYAYRFSAIRPYAIDKNKKKIDSPAVNAIYRPNKQFGVTQFLDTIAVGVLTQPEIYILVWRREGRQVFPGGKITKDNIGGYTFLTGASKVVTMGEVTYQVTNSKGELLKYREDEVMTLTDSRNPADLSQGYSPAQAAEKWSTIDDYIAAYQRGYFQNGAIPAGQFMITARTKQEFEDIVGTLQARHRGAGSNNNVTYSHRPINPTTGQSEAAKIEWVPFNVQNKDLELGTIFDNTNKKIDSAFGVPAIVRGVDDSATYANAQVAEKNFIVNRLDPFTNSIWSQWTHELNRITGGIDVAIVYDLDIPSVADEDRVEAERKKIESDIIKSLIAEGFSIENIVDAFDFSDKYKRLVKKVNTDDGDGGALLEVEDGSEVEAPDSDQHKKASRGSERKSPKAKAISESTRLKEERKLESVIRQHMEIQIDRAIKDTKAVADMPAEQVELFVDDMMGVIVSGMLAQGVIEYAEGLAMLEASGLSTYAATEFILSEVQQARYRKYLKNIAKSYTNMTAASIRSVLDVGNSEEITRAELIKRLRNIMNTDEWRVLRLANTEVNRSLSLSSVLSMQQIQAETDVQIEKGLLHTGGDMPCEYCATMLNTWWPVDDYIIKKGDIIEGRDGGLMEYTWDDNDGHGIHANCHCTSSYRVRPN